jgi:hypothetical protein
MTKFILLLLVSAAATPSVQAADLKDSQHDTLTFCRQFVIRDPDPQIRFGYTRDCDLRDPDNPYWPYLQER